MVQRKDCASRRIPDSLAPNYKRYADLHITCPPDLADRLETYAAEQERAKSWVIQKALDEWLTSKGY